MKDLQKATIMGMLVPPVVGFTKLTLLTLFYHLFWPHYATRIGSLIGIIIVAIIYFILFVLFVYWGTQTDALSSAVNRLNPLNTALAVINVVTDFYILLLPVRAVWGLNLAKNKKLGLSLLFGTGLLYG